MPGSCASAMTSASSWSPGSGEVIDRIVGLEVGADDYVSKPFDPRELLARIKSVMRCMCARPETAAAPPARQSLRPASAGAALDLQGAPTVRPRQVDEVPITAMEFDLLKVFVENPGKALSRDRLLTLTKNREWDPFDRSIDIRVARLRRKLEAGMDGSERDPHRPRGGLHVRADRRLSTRRRQRLFQSCNSACAVTSCPAYTEMDRRSTGTPWTVDCSGNHQVPCSAPHESDTRLQQVLDYTSALVFAKDSAGTLHLHQSPIRAALRPSFG